MKYFHILAFLVLGQCCLGQVDTTRNHELRFSLIGQNAVPYTMPVQRNAVFPVDPTITYLKRIKDDYFFKSQLSFRTVFGNAPVIQDTVIGDTNFSLVDLFLGIERQEQFKHWGFFISAGLYGMTSQFSGDFVTSDENEVRDYVYTFYQTGIEGQATFYTNLGDNIYIYVTGGAQISVSRGNQNQNVISDLENGTWYPDFNMTFIDAVGIAYKF